jgi:hypothetical protein
MSTTDLSKKQLTIILSALDDAPRNPANKAEALRAIRRSAQRLGLTTEDVLAAAPGLLDGRMSPAEFRAELHDLAGTEPQEEAPFVEVTGAPQAATEAQEAAPADQEPAAAEPAPEPAQAPGEAEPEAQAVAPDAAQPVPAAAQEEQAPAPEPETVDTKPPATRTPRAGTKQAQMIELLKRPEGATVEQIAEATGWQHHTIRGAISGALKKKLGLAIEATRTREVGPNKAGAKGSSTVYRIVGSSPRTS